MDAERAEFLKLLEAAKLADPSRPDDAGQAALSRHLGVAKTTVNRWLTDRADSKPPPRAVILFLRAYNRLSPKQRAEVLSS